MWVAPESAQQSELGSSESGEKTQPGARVRISDATVESLDDMDVVFDAAE